MSPASSPDRFRLSTRLQRVPRTKPTHRSCVHARDVTSAATNSKLTVSFPGHSSTRRYRDIVSRDGACAHCAPLGATDIAQPRALRVKASRKHASAPQLDVEMAPAEDEPVAPEHESTAGLSEPAAPAQPAQRERSRDRRQRRLDALAERASNPYSHRLSSCRGRRSVQAVQSQSHATREPQEARGGGRWRTGRCRRCARGHRQLASSGRCSSVDDRRGVYAQVSEAAEGRGRGCSACVERDRENDRGSAS